MDSPDRSGASRRPTPRARILLTLSFAAAASLLVPGDGRAAQPSAEEIFDVEAQMLGHEHAREHQMSRGAAATGEPEGPQVTPANKWTGGPRSEVGRWTGAYFELPTYAIHATMLPTGKVMFWGYPNYESDGEGSYTRGNDGEAAIWDPALGANESAITVVEPPRLEDFDADGEPDPTPIYCSGQSLLPSGEVLIAGGNLVWPDFSENGFSSYGGLPHTFTFDPFSETYKQQAHMVQGRWYPSQALMGDGRTLVLGGYNEQPAGGIKNPYTEVFSIGRSRGATGSWAASQSAIGFEDKAGLYPHLYTLPDGRVLMAGPNRLATRMFDPGSDTWGSPISSQLKERTGGTAVPIYPTSAGTSKLAQIGGYDGRWFDQGGDYDPETKVTHSTASTEYFDASNPGAGWRQWDPLVLNRSYHNTVLLPDRSMVTVGGGTGNDPKEGNWAAGTDGERRRVELWDPKTREWRLGPSQREDRSYHSTAVLLPDGRVFSAGDDHHPYKVGAAQAPSAGNVSSFDTAEIYKPPYLFADGPRPKIQKVQSRLNYGDVFGVRTKRGRGSSAVLVAPSATTHAADMHQRLVPLVKTRKVRRKGFNFKTPPDVNVAPPGYYMLFVLSGKGKPSVAEWVRLDPRARDAKGIGAL